MEASRTRIFAVIFVVALSLQACATALPSIPEGASAAVIIQRAQERSDVYDWKGAERYYQVLMERYGQDPELAATAEYEIAFTKYKRGDMKGARAGFEALLARYRAPGAELLSPTWRILAQKVLAGMPAAPSASAANGGTAGNL